MAKKNGSNGKRMTNKDRIMKAWGKTDQVWPPALGDKVKLFTPKDLRGKVGRVIAVGEEKTKTSTRVAPRGKARVAVRAGGESYQFAVAKSDVFPNDITLKELQSI
jgi:hypothetical protein